MPGAIYLPKGHFLILLFISCGPTCFSLIQIKRNALDLLYGSGSDFFMRVKITLLRRTYFIYLKKAV